LSRWSVSSRIIKGRVVLLSPLDNILHSNPSSLILSSLNKGIDSDACQVRDHFLDLLIILAIPDYFAPSHK
jgi:hypothetical protein